MDVSYVGMEFSLLQVSNTWRLLLENGASAVFSWNIRNMVLQFDIEVNCCCFCPNKKSEIQFVEAEKKASILQGMLLSLHKRWREESSAYKDGT